MSKTLDIDFWPPYTLEHMDACTTTHNKHIHMCPLTHEHTLMKQTKIIALHPKSQTNRQNETEQ